jgi:hypothetical protein
MSGGWWGDERDQQVPPTTFRTDALLPEAPLGDGPHAGLLAAAWARIRARLRQDVGDVEYKTCCAR